MTPLPYIAACFHRERSRCNSVGIWGKSHFRWLVIGLALFVLFLDLSPLRGQHFKPTFRQFTMEDGIPQSQIRSINRGPEGLFWISTQSGLTVFDGQQFYTQLLDDLRGLYLVNAIKTENRLFLNTLGEVLIYGDSLYSPKSKAKFVGNKDLLGCPDSNLCFVLNHPPESEAELLYLDGDSLKDVAMLNPKLAQHTVQSSYTYPEINKSYFITKAANILEYDASQNKIFRVDSLLLTGFDTVYGNWNRPFISGVMADGCEEVYFLSQEQASLIAIRKEGKSNFTAQGKSPPKVIFHKRWGEFELFQLKDSIYRAFDALPAQMIRNLIWEKNAAYAISDRGVFVIYNNGLEQSMKERWTYPWSIIPWSDSTVCIGTYQDGLYISDSDGQTVQQMTYPPMKSNREANKYIDKPPEILSNTLATPRWQLWGSTNGFLSYDRHTKNLQYQPQSFAVEAFGYDDKRAEIFTADKTLCQRNTEDLSIKNCKPLPQEILLNSVATDMLVTDAGHYWVSGRGGVVQLGRTDSSKIYTKNRGNFPFRAAISLVENPQHGLWAGCSDGLAYFENNEWRSVRKDWIQGNINQLLILDSGLSVAVSPFSIYIFEIQKDSIQPLYTYSRYNGYGPTEPSENGLFYEENSQRVWIPTVDGVYRLNLSGVPRSKVKAQLSVIGINDQLWESSQTHTTVMGTFVEVSLSIVDPHNQKWQYRYQLNDEEMSPLIDDATFLISNLQHGENNIILQAIRPEQPQRSIDTQLAIVTRLPVLNQPAFVWGLIAFILGLLALLFSVVVRDYRRNKRLQRLELEFQFNRLKTLEAYFNPHFIFNTLTAIQDNILQRNKERGNELIIKLSRIFRYALKIDPAFIENGARGKKLAGVPLSEELQLIRDYVFLQQAQQPDIKYEEQIDPEALHQDIHIPKLLIQPFVENIFKHAFPYRENQDKITLRVKLNNSRLSITLLDNGRGQQPNDLQTERQSLGKKLAHERMRILQNMGIQNKIFITHDAHGTRVKIHIDYESYCHRR